MSESDLEKAAKEISKDIDILMTLREKLDSVCPDPKGNHEDIDFQKIQVS